MKAENALGASSHNLVCLERLGCGGAGGHVLLHLLAHVLDLLHQLHLQRAADAGSVIHISRTGQWL